MIKMLKLFTKAIIGVFAIVALCKMFLISRMATVVICSVWATLLLLIDREVLK